MADLLVKPAASRPPRICDLGISYHRKRRWWELREEGEQSPNALAAKERRPELGTRFTQQGDPVTTVGGSSSRGLTEQGARLGTKNMAPTISLQTHMC